MPEVIVNTSPLQYLFQLGVLDLLPEIYRLVLVPQGVCEELSAGRDRGVSLPDPAALPWLKTVRVQNVGHLALAPDLGKGEREVLALALQMDGPLVILDDSLARRFAERFQLRLTGTLGVLLKARRMGKIEGLAPLLDRLEKLSFRLDPKTRAHVLKLAE